MIFIIYPLARSLWTSLIANGKFSFTNYSYVFKSSWLRNSLFNSLNLGVDRQRRVALDRHYRLLWRNYLWLFRETVGLQLVFRLGKLHLRLGCWQREDNLPQLVRARLKSSKKPKRCRQSKSCIKTPKTQVSRNMFGHNHGLVGIVAQSGQQLTCIPLTCIPLMAEIQDGMKQINQMMSEDKTLPDRKKKVLLPKWFV
jgi:hypothetical protein